MSTLSELLDCKEVTLAEVTDLLDKLNPPERINQVVAKILERYPPQS